jgi:hypothetical protein
LKPLIPFIDQAAIHLASFNDTSASIQHVLCNTAPLIADSDKCIRDLATIVNPVRFYRRYRGILMFAGVIGITLAISAFNERFFGGFNPKPILAVSLGLLGAGVYGLFVDIGAVPQEQFDNRGEYSGYARLVLGALLGFVLYFAFSQSAFESTEPVGNVERDGPERALFLLLPFIAGYSTLLVVHLLRRLTDAVEVIFGLEQSSVLEKRMEVLEQTVSSKGDTAATQEQNNNPKKEQPTTPKGDTAA